MATFSPLNVIISEFMEISGIKSEKEAREALKVESLKLKQRIKRNEDVKELTKKEVILLRWIALFKQLPPTITNTLLKQANLQSIVEKELRSEAIAAEGAVDAHSKRKRRNTQGER